MKYIEYDAAGNIINSVEVYVTEGREVGPLQPDMTPEQKTAHKAKIDKAVKDREQAVRKELDDKAKVGSRLVLLEDADPMPDPFTRRVNPTTKKIENKPIAVQ